MQYRERAEPFAAKELKVNQISMTNCCNTAKGQNPLRLILVYQSDHQNVQVAIPRKGRTLCGHLSLQDTAILLILHVAIPRKGRTLCGVPVVADLVRVAPLQYRERAEPFAASNIYSEEQNVILLQYRERAEPFAACRIPLTWVPPSGVGCNTAKGQNPLRLARRTSVGMASWLVAIPRKGRTLCGHRQCGTSTPSWRRCNTAKGQNPLRLNIDEIVIDSNEVVAIPRKGRTLCGSGIFQPLYHKGSPGVKNTPHFDSGQNKSLLHSILPHF